MPFTFSHPALVLPLTFLPRRWFSASGLVVGSMAPDFEYFIRMKMHGEWGHTLWGVFGFDLPLALLLLFVFHNGVHRSLTANLPGFLRARFWRFRDLDWNGYFRRRWWVVIVSILIGIFSHLLWDSFTHADGLFARMIPALQKHIVFLSTDFHVTRFVQHGGTVIGGLFIIWYVMRMPRYRRPTPSSDSRYWVVVAFFSAVVTAAALLIGGLGEKWWGTVIVVVISAVLISLTLAGYGYKFAGQRGNGEKR